MKNILVFGCKNFLVFFRNLVKIKFIFNQAYIKILQSFFFVRKTRKNLEEFFRDTRGNDPSKVQYNELNRLFKSG